MGANGNSHPPKPDESARAEILRAAHQDILETWVRPLIGAEDPVGAIARILRGLTERQIESAFGPGCPLHDLAREMSPIDPEFRGRIEEVYRLWRGAIAEALERGRAARTVRKDANARAAAIFVVASYEGIVGLARLTRDPGVLQAASGELVSYLEDLRAR